MYLYHLVLLEHIWKVARYTSAAPMFFSEFENYVDGGVLANNPSDAALARIQRYYRESDQRLPIACVVSLGSGLYPAVELGNTGKCTSLVCWRCYPGYLVCGWGRCSLQMCYTCGSHTDLHEGLRFGKLVQVPQTLKNLIELLTSAVSNQSN